MKSWFICNLVCGWLMLIIAGCQAVPTERALPPTDIPPNVVEATAFLPTATPVLCTPSPAGLTLKVTPTTPTSVLVEMQGLGPGETLTLLFNSMVPGSHFSQTEEHPLQPVDANGSFSYEVLGLRPLPGSTVNEWHVQVVHSGGVACTRVILP